MHMLSIIYQSTCFYNLCFVYFKWYNVHVYQLTNALNKKEVPWKPKDFPVRKGLTHKPLTMSSQHSTTITHAYINGTRWFVKYLSHVIIDWRAWPEFGKEDIRGQHTWDSKEKVIAIEKTGMLVEQVQQVSHGGTSTDGNTGRRFSSEIFP